MQRAASKRTAGPNARAVDLLLDSGAFSAWRKGEQIDLRAYIEFIQTNYSLLHAYVNLDVIPGRPNKSTLAVDIEAAAAESYKNYQAMKKAGLDPIPVFHLGEHDDWLRRILDSGAKWIGLGGSVGKPEETRSRFFERSFNVIKKSGASVRVHGFGATSVKTMVRFPWYSVDSTSWVITSAMGSILVPAVSASGLDFSKLSVIRVTGEGSQTRQAFGFGPLYRAHLDSFLAGENSGLAQVCNNQHARNQINIRCFMRAAQAAGVQIFFSTWMRESDNQSPQLTAAGARRRLVSYYEARKHPNQLSEYIMTGSLITPKPSSTMGEYSLLSYRGRRIETLIARASIREELEETQDAE